ncbi:GD18859 [Drosophila simulans]|uniref:GD18859 n=1 Tax=Drosophila simulans TaxID=7240 RepID=B4QS65_DROSI|nr:GD18859 [Drosophila simulans]
MVHKSGLYLLVATAICALGGCHGANILGVFPSLSPSHLIIQMSTAKVLAERGQNVTVITVLNPVVSLKNITVIPVPLTQEDSQPMSCTLGAMESVVYWTEYVIRHHGAAHLQSPLVHMSYIAANNIDIYALIAVILVILVLLLKLLLQFIYRKFVSKPKKQKKH